MYAKITRVGQREDGSHQLEVCLYYLETNPKVPLNVDAPEYGTFGEHAIPLPKASETVTVEITKDMSGVAEAEAPANAIWSALSWTGKLFVHEAPDEFGYNVRKVNPYTAKLNPAFKLIPVADYVEPSDIDEPLTEPE